MTEPVKIIPTQPNPDPSVGIVNKEAGPIGPGSETKPVEEFVKRSSELPTIAPDLKLAGVKSNGLQFSNTAIDAGVIPANPSLAGLGNKNWPYPTDQVEKLAEGNPNIGPTNIAKIEFKELKKAA